MKVLLKVLSTLLFVAVMFGGLMMIMVDVKNGSDVAEMEGNPLGGLVKSMAPEIGSSSTWFAYAGIWAFSALLALLGIIATFMKKAKFGIAIGALAIVMMLTNFGHPGGGASARGGGANPKGLALTLAFMGIAASGALILRHTKFKDEVA
jgi:hypothetical protein